MGDVLLSSCLGPLFSLEALILLFICRDHSTPPLLASEHGIGSLGFRWSYADNFGVLARGANCTNVHLARLIAEVKRAGLHVHDISLASGCADVLNFEVCPASAYCRNEMCVFGQSREKSLCVDASAAKRWTSSVVTSLFFGAQQPWCALNPCQVRAGVSFGIRGAMVNRAQGTESTREDSVSTPQSLESALP